MGFSAERAWGGMVSGKGRAGGIRKKIRVFSSSSPCTIPAKAIIPPYTYASMQKYTMYVYIYV